MTRRREHIARALLWGWFAVTVVALVRGAAMEGSEDVGCGGVDAPR
jgi:hypothetical protein